MSLFTTNLIFEDKKSNSCDESFDHDISGHINDIESNILNLLDEDP